MKSIFRVYELKNQDLFTGGEKVLVAEIPGTKRDLRRWVAYGGVMPTHIGELVRIKDGYTYFTTIGRTYVFVRSTPCKD
jgi:hypothetical protein